MFIRKIFLYHPAHILTSDEMVIRFRVIKEIGDGRRPDQDI